MKKLFFTSAVLAIFMISCTDSKTTDSTTTSTSSAEKNRENINAVYKGIDTGDMSRMDEFIAEDIVDHYGMSETRGRDSVKKMLGEMHTHFSNLKMDVLSEATSSNGDYHFTLVRMTGTTTDDKMGMPANTPVDETSVDVVKIKDGKAVEHWGFDDPKMMMKRMEMNKNMPPMNNMDHKMMNDKMKMKDSSNKM